MNVVPGVVSVYRWKGAVQRDDELLLVMKTRAEKVEALRARLLALHSYELPEVVVLSIAGGHAPYLDWIAEACGLARRLLRQRVPLLLGERDHGQAALT